MKANKTTRGQEVLNHRRKDEQSESNIDLVANTQIFKQQKQLNGRNQHMPMNINSEYQWTQLPYQKILFSKLY
jgi:hypothetical protein